MARNFKELEAKMPPARLVGKKARAREAMAGMLLAEPSATCYNLPESRCAGVTSQTEPGEAATGPC